MAKDHTLLDQYDRPKTRGELRDKLRDGISCEVAAHVANMTSIMLKGWLEFEAFTIDQSPNEGWVIFKPQVTSMLILTSMERVTKP